MRDVLPSQVPEEIKILLIPCAVVRFSPETAVIAKPCRNIVTPDPFSTNSTVVLFIAEAVFRAEFCRYICRADPLSADGTIITLLTKSALNAQLAIDIV
jgi:hypothetical protein